MNSKTKKNLINIFLAAVLLIVILTSPIYAQASESIQYGYDDANQVQSADYDDGAGMPIDYDVNYSYDSSENRLSRDVLTQQNALANNPPGSFTLSSPADAAPVLRVNAIAGADA